MKNCYFHFFAAQERIKKWKLVAVPIKPEDISNVDSDGWTIIPADALRRRFELNIQVVAGGVTNRMFKKNLDENSKVPKSKKGNENIYLFIINYYLPT